MLSIFLPDSLPLDRVIERLPNVARHLFLSLLFIGVNVYGSVGIYQIISTWITLEVTVRPLMHFPPFTSRIGDFSLNMAP